MHRLGLSETILVFPEHLAFCPATLRGRGAAATAGAGKETHDGGPDLDEALAAARAGFDVIQAEKFSPEDIARLSESLRERRTRSRRSPPPAASNGQCRRLRGSRGRHSCHICALFRGAQRCFGDFVADCQDFTPTCVSAAFRCATILGEGGARRLFFGVSSSVPGYLCRKSDDPDVTPSIHDPPLMISK